MRHVARRCLDLFKIVYQDIAHRQVVVKQTSSGKTPGLRPRSDSCWSPIGRIRQDPVHDRRREHRNDVRRQVAQVIGVGRAFNPIQLIVRRVICKEDGPTLHPERVRT